MPNAKVAEPGAAAEAWAASEPADDARLARMRALLEQSSPKKAPRESYQDPMVLSSGYAMPRVGLGTAHLFEAQIAANLAAGARHLDCARIYGNEAAVGRAVRASGVPRCELFLTTKLWMDEARPERVAAAVDDSLARLQTSYVDLLLIHWPLKFRPGTVLARDGAVGDFSATWAAMEALAASGKARSLGVSNFDEAQLSRLLDDAKTIPPAVNQVEAHPKFPNQALVDFCLSRDVAVVAWGPLGGDPRRLGEDSMLWATAKMHAVSLCRCALRWNLERGVAVIPKSTRPAHVADALAATAGPRLTADDRRLLADSRRRGARRFPDVIGVWPATAFVGFRLVGWWLHVVFSALFAVVPGVDAVGFARARAARKERRYAAAVAARDAAADAKRDAAADAKRD